MELGIEDIMFNAAFFKEFGQLFRLLDARRSYKDRTALLVKFLNSICHGAVLSTARFIDDIWIVDTDIGFICRHNHNIKAVDLLEFLLFGLGRTGHARELIIHTEVVLESDGGKCLAFPFDLDMFLCLNGLMQPFAVPAAKHEATRKFIDNDDFPILYDIIAVTVHEGLGLQGCHELME